MPALLLVDLAKALSGTLSPWGIRLGATANGEDKVDKTIENTWVGGRISGVLMHAANQSSRERLYNTAFLGVPRADFLP
ncbi:hypothetical protein TgHK011_004791 [Trichoderma gracile]|nr:hypothetical protein TgHK011_004791 [Trichoderma gracile]